MESEMMEEKRIHSIALTRNNILSFRDYLGEELLSMYKKGDCFAVGLLEEQTTAGVIFCRENREENLIEVLQLYVDEEVRRRGGGRLLVARACTNAALRGHDKVVIQYGKGEDAEIKAFLEEYGFLIFEDEENMETTAVLSLDNNEITGDELMEPEEAVMYQGDAAYTLPLLSSMTDLLAERGFKGNLVSGGGLPPFIQLKRKDGDTSVTISIDMISPETGEYSVSFFMKKKLSEEKDFQEVPEQSVEAVSIIRDEDRNELIFMLSAPFDGGIPEEEEFFGYFAQFLGETQKFC